MEMMDLSSYRGKKHVVLYFYPRDGTPACTIQAIGFSDREHEFIKLDTVVFGVSRDDVLSHQAFRDEHGLQRRLVASDALGTLTVAPLVIGLASLVRNVPSAREATESALAIALVCVLCAMLVFLPSVPWTFELATISLCPLFVWIAARLPPGITTAATFICAITIVATTTFTIGIFGDPLFSIEQRIRSAQASILAISFGALVLTALFSERRLQGIALLDREARLQEALRAGGVMAFEWDLAADQVRHSQNALPILGFGSKDVVGGSEMLGQIHPDVCDQLEVPSFLLFELDFEQLLKYAPRQIMAHILPRFPSVERDFAVVVERDFELPGAIAVVGRVEAIAAIDYIAAGAAALLAEGGQLEDPASYVKRVNSLLMA
jgi:PAS domain-containing protein